MYVVQLDDHFFYQMFCCHWNLILPVAPTVARLPFYFTPHKVRSTPSLHWSTPILDRLFSFTTTDLLQTFNDRKYNKMPIRPPTDFHYRFIFINLVQILTCPKYLEIIEIVFFVTTSIHPVVWFRRGRRLTPKRCQIY